MTSFEDLISLAQHVVDKCMEKHIVICAAESCTGGMLSALITSIPGSSAVLDRAFITYSYDSKIEILDVSYDLLYKKGAVSREVSHEMAEGALDNSNANLAVAITGIAGPTGATEKKPIGLVNFAIATKNGNIETFEEIFPGSRSEVRLAACKFALSKILEIIS